MDWMATLATVIAVLRLGLICCGLWVLLRFTAKQLDFQRKCFAFSGVIYLLGLMPQSLLLLLNFDFVSFLLDTGYLCGTQNFACTFAVALHNIIFLYWIIDCIRSQNNASQVKVCTYFSAFYVAVLILVRGFFLRTNEGRSFYTDIATKTPPMEHQVIRLQLLLCESSICENQVRNFLLVSYSFFMLPVLLLYFVGKSFIQRKPTDCHLEEQKGGQHFFWWEQEQNIQRFLSATITIWFYLIQPIIFALRQHHFVDFGTHLLMTMCVFSPWTLSEKEQNSLQSWV